jgi:hypothetical protein
MHLVSWKKVMVTEMMITLIAKHSSIFLGYLKIRSLIGRDDSFYFSALGDARSTQFGIDPETFIEIARILYCNKAQSIQSKKGF